MEEIKIPTDNQINNVAPSFVRSVANQPYINGNSVDKTPNSDVVEFSHYCKKQDGIGKKLVAGIMGAFIALGGIAAFVISKGKNKKGIAEGAKELVSKTEKLAVESGNAKDVQTIKKLELGNTVELSGSTHMRNRWNSGSEYIRKNGLAGFDNKYTLSVLEECENLTFNSPNLKLMKDKYGKLGLAELGQKYGVDASRATAEGATVEEIVEVINKIKEKASVSDLSSVSMVIYDLGLRYAIIANNTARATGSGAIINEVPKIFKGIDSKVLVNKLDKLSAQLPKEGNVISTFEIGGKEYSAQCISEGLVSRVYKITDKAGNEICFKKAKDPFYCYQSHGIYAETALAQEAYKAGVVDVPKFYMGNPIGKFIDEGTSSGAWQLVEFVNPTKKPAEGLKFMDWIASKGLVNADVNPGTKVGEYIVDLGGMIDNARTYSKLGDISPILKGYVNGETTNDMLKALVN